MVDHRGSWLHQGEPWTARRGGARLAPIPMQVTVNGEGREVPAEISVRALIQLLELTEGPVAVERNGEVVPRAEHGAVRLAEGDVLEIVHFVGGG